MSEPVTLHLLEQAEKEVMKLSRMDKGAFLEFMYKFRNIRTNPDSTSRPCTVTTG